MQRNFNELALPAQHLRRSHATFLPSKEISRADLPLVRRQTIGAS